MISELKKQYNLRYYQEHHAELLAQKKAYREANLETLKQRERCYCRKNRETIGKKNKRYYAEHAERLKAQGHEYRKENRGTILIRLRAYYHKNREKLLADSRAKYPSKKEAQAQWWQKYYQKNRERINQRNSDNQKKNAGKTLSYQAKRRTRKLNSFVPEQEGIVKAFYASIRSRPFVKCYWCGAKVSGSDIHVDHVIALAKGGNHAIENLAASCAPCNRSKQAKLPHEWAKHPQMFFTL